MNNFIMGMITMYVLTMICFVVADALSIRNFETYFFMPWSLIQTGLLWVRYLRKKRLAKKIVNLKKFKETNHQYCYTQIDYLTDCISLKGLQDMYKKYKD